MNLNQSIVEVIQITANLRATLDDGDLLACATLMAQRATAIKNFLRMHRDATSENIRACSTLLTELQEADRELQELSQTTRDAISRDWNRTMGQTPVPRHDYDRMPELACLDRKA